MNTFLKRKVKEKKIYFENLLNRKTGLKSFFNVYANV